MARIGWSFYRARKSINLRNLVTRGRDSDYSSFMAYCAKMDVIPVSQQEFDREFGPLFSEAKHQSRVLLTPDLAPGLSAEPPPTVSIDQSTGVEATIWLAGVEDDGAAKQQALEPSPASSKSSKKKHKESPPEPPE